MNLYDNSNIDCNKKNRNKLYDFYNNIILNKFVHSNKYKNNFLFGNYKQGHFITNARHDKVECKARRSSVVVRPKELVLCTLITSVFRVLLSNK